ncbi:hypothetical protein BJ741DRAFT_527132, partial [Chytriomyces cf. hyalinus JEL632]
DDITTIFVVGFPEDIQDREFQNMFVFAPGFEAATLKFPANFAEDDGVPAYKKQIIGFAKFRSRKEANFARDYLTGRKVDTERGSILKAEIAKKNLHVKRSATATTADFHAPQTPTPDTLLSLPPGLKISTKNASSMSSGPMTAPMSQTTSLLSSLGEQRTHSNNSSMLGSNDSRSAANPLGSKFPPLSISIPNAGSVTPTLQSAPFSNAVTAAGVASAGFRCPADQNPPCNTLYVGNLATNTNETELRDLFSRVIGYKRMSYRMRPNGPMVFVEFESITSAQQALQDMHGTLLSTSTKGGIRLSFSKNPLGVRPSGLQTPSGNSSMPPPSPSMMTPMASSYLADF